MSIFAHMKDIIVKIKDWIRTDGLLHIFVSFGIMFILGWALNWYVSSVVALCIGVLKEIYDKITGNGCAELHDIICDCIGIVAGSLILLLYAI